MKKTTSQNIRQLSDGIGGLYRTKRYRLRRIMKIVPVVVLITAILAGSLYAVFAPPPQTWDGELIAVFGNLVFYKKYLFHERLGYPEFLSSFSMTEDEFLEKAGFVPISYSKHKKALEERGILDQIDQEAMQELNWKSIKTVYFILVDGDGNVLYDGTYSYSVIDLLKANGFSAGG